MRSFIGGSFLILLLATSGRASVIANVPYLPPAQDPSVGYYSAPPGTNITYQASGNTFVLSQLTIIRSDLNLSSSSWPDHQLFLFNVRADSLISINGGPAAPCSLSGPCSEIVYHAEGTTLGTFDSELAYNPYSGNDGLDLQGNLGTTPVLVRESPTLSSTGETSVEELGPDIFRITSFFDIFTELSLDEGQTWIPQSDGPTHIEYVSVPEPNVIALLVPLGMLFWCRNCRHPTPT